MALLEKQLSVKTSTIPSSGNGLFTTRSISRGARIVEYKGRVSTWKEVNHNNGDNGYIYFMNRKHVIDASKTLKSLARFANDARGLGQVKGIKNNSEYVEDGTRVYIVAKRDIAAGEEILVGYGPEYWKTIRFNIKLEIRNRKIDEQKIAARKKLAAKKEAARVKILKRKLDATSRRLVRQARKLGQQNPPGGKSGMDRKAA